MLVAITRAVRLPNWRPRLVPRPAYPLAIAVACVATAAPALADRLENKVALFAALDKVTARISKLEVPLDQTVEFGSLKVTPRTCFTRPPTEQPKTSSFVEVEEKELDGTQKRVFSGWMFAESPGLNAVEHPVFDIWLTGCKQPTGANAQAAAGGPPQPGGAEPPEGEGPASPRRRVRR